MPSWLRYVNTPTRTQFPQAPTTLPNDKARRSGRSEGLLPLPRNNTR